MSTTKMVFWLFSLFLVLAWAAWLFRYGYIVTNDQDSMVIYRSDRWTGNLWVCMGVRVGKVSFDESSSGK